MAYLPPSVILREEFLALSTNAAQQFNACLVGPNYRIFSYANVLDRALCGVGAYSASTGGVFAYPSLPAGGVVDPASVSLTLENVLAQFATVSGSGVAARPASTSNAVTLGNNAVGAFQANGSSARLSALGTRDLAIGDYVKVAGATSGANVTTKILGFGQASIAASAGSFSGGTANQGAQSRTVAVTVATANGNHAAAEYTTSTVYTGSLVTGVLSDTYTLTCTAGGAGTAAVFAVTSLKGDNVASVQAPALGGQITVGTRGLVLTLSGTGNYVAGESYSIACQAAFATQTPAIVSAAYVGTSSATYQIKVVRGGTWTQGPVVSVSTLDGSDYQTPQTLAFNTSFVLGTKGITAKFAGSTVQNGLLAGDTYLVTVTAASTGAVTTLYTVDPLPSGITTNEDLALTFYISKSSVSVAASGYPFTGSTALIATTDAVTVSANLQVVDMQFVDGQGNFVALPVISASLYVNYRALLTAQANVVQTLSDRASVAAVLGRVESGNRLAYALDKALANSAGQPVNFVALDQDSLQGYTDALGALEKSESSYFCVPADDTLAVRQLFQAHEQAMSNPSVAMERVALGGNFVSATLSLYDKKTDGSYWTGYVAANPASQATVYTKLTIPGAAFLTAGVRAGDLVRTSYALDATGAVTYASAKVASVLDNQNLLLAGTGFGAAVGSSGLPVRVSIIRVPTPTELAATAAAQSSAFADRRFFSILPNRDPAASTAQAVAAGAEPLWSYVAAVAGLKSAVAPHQGITNAVLTGFTETLNYFTPTQLNVIAGGGTLIVTQDAPGGPVYVRHQLSTDMTDDNTREMSICVNTDWIKKDFQVDLKQFLGRYNNTDNLEQLVFTLGLHKFDQYLNKIVTPTAGPQITSFDPADLVVKVDPVTRTLLNFNASFGEPYPCNNIQGSLTIV